MSSTVEKQMQYKEKVEIAYRPVSVKALADIVHRYMGLSSYEIAVKLMLDEELMVWKKDANYLNKKD